MKKIRLLPTADPERLTMTELLVLHERVFGPLEPQAKTRLTDAAARSERTWNMDGLAA